MSAIAYNAGLISDDDKLRLSSGLIHKGSYIYDRANGASHQLSRFAVYIIEGLVEPIYWWQLRRRLQNRYLATETIQTVFNFLDSIGGLQVDRTRRSALNDLYYRANMKLHFVKVDKPSQRFEGDITGAIQAVIRAMRLTNILMLFTAIIAYGLNISVSTIVWVTITFYGCLLISTVVHELVHIYFVTREPRHCLYKPALLIRGSRIGVLHPTLDHKDELLSAVSGPVAGALVSILILPLSLLATLWFSWIIGISVAIFHLCSWMPGFSDGRVIWGFIQEARYATKT